MKAVVERLRRLARPTRDRPVYIISGLPRSGTSMMMRMLEAGGLPALTDAARGPDANNPEGYYELERVKRLREGDRDWVADARGKAVKVISELLRFLPDGYEYRVIFMRRSMDEILSSQREMLDRLGVESRGVNDDRMAELYEKHLRAVESWLDRQKHIRTIYVSYNEVITDPQREAERLRRLLGVPLKIDRMAAVIEPSLYRHRR